MKIDDLFYSVDEHIKTLLSYKEDMYAKIK